MRRLIVISLLGVVSFGTAIAWGQNPYYRPQQISRPTSYDPSPTVSPYLNLVPLVDSDGQLRYIDGAYQSFVRPQLEQREAIRQQQAQLTQLQARMDRVQTQRPSLEPTRRTGHVARFQSYAHFYPQLNVAPK